MISSVFKLKETDIIPNKLAPMQQTGLEENYAMKETFDFLLECQNKLNQCRQEYYKTVLENDNPYLINESYNEILITIKNIIRKILAYIETLIKRFITQAAKYVKSDKYLYAMRKEIKKFPRGETFQISGYNFTINENIPAVDIHGLDLNNLRSELNKILQDNDIESVIYSLIDLESDFKESKMDEIRGEILNTSPVEEKDFTNQIFAVFRDNASSESYIRIGHKEVMETLDEYFDINDKIKEVNALYYKIQSKYKELEKQVNEIAKLTTKVDGSSRFNNDSLDTEKEKIVKRNNALNDLITKLVDQIRRISTLHLQAVRGKLDAYAALLVQDRNILYKALNTVQSETRNTFVMNGLKQESYDYTRDVYNESYLLEKEELILRQQRFVEECLALAESNIPELKVIREDLDLDVKNKFDKFKEIVEKIFAKFNEKIQSFFKTNKKFLEDNKDTILNKKVPEYTINNMPPYSLGIQNINNTNLPATADMSKLLPLTEVEIQKIILPKYDGNGDFAEFAKRFFLCDNKENEDRKSTDQEINMKDIYEFCANPEGVKIIANKVKTYASEVAKVKAEIVRSSVKKESFEDLGAVYQYSSVLEMYINEADPGDTKKEPETTIEKNTNNQSSSDQNAKDGSKLNLDPDKEDKKQDQNNTNNKEENKSSNNKAKETGNWYLKNLNIALAAKMTAYQKIYSEYMGIIKHHVKLANGEGEETTNKDDSQVRNAMKEYLDADSEDAKKSAIDKIISAMKAYNGKTIDAHDAVNLANKNKAALGK